MDQLPDFIVEQIAVVRIIGLNHKSDELIFPNIRQNKNPFLTKNPTKQ